MKLLFCLGGLALTIAIPGSSAELGQGWWHGRYVTYNVRDGEAVYQGDIHLGPADAIPKEPLVSKASGDRHSAFLTGLNNANLWPNGVVPYTIGGGAPAAMVGFIKQAITVYANNTPIQWVPRTNEANYVKFIVQPAGIGSCGYSDGIGLLGGAQNIAVATDPNCDTLGTFVHEMGHAIGLEHEQTRADRDYYVKVRFENVDKNNANQYQADPAQIDVLPYEQGSIMHYGVSDYQRNNLNTIDTIPLGIPIEHRNSLSPGDIEAIRTVYGTPSTTTTIYTNPRNLKVIVDGVAIAAAQSFNWAPGSRHTVDIPAGPQQNNPSTRWVFARWSDDSPQSHTIVAGPATRTLCANFAIQYLVQIAVGTGGGGTVTASPASPDGYYPLGTYVTLTANPAAGFRFLQWDNPNGIDSYSHGLSSSPASFSVNYPGYNYTADFTNAPITAITTNVPGASVAVDGTTTSLPANFAWAAGSAHKLAVPTLSQDNGAGSPYRSTFKSWSVGAGASISVTAGASGGYIASTWTRKFLVSTYVSDPVYGIGSGNGKLTVSPASTECDSPANCYYEAGTTVSFMPSGVAPFVFGGWSGDLTGVTQPGSILVNDQVYLVANFAQPGQLTAAGVTNVANYGNLGVAPGEILAIFGMRLGPPDQLQVGQVFNNVLSNNVAQTRVLFDGVPAPLIYVSSGQISAVVPYAVASRASTRVQIEYQGKVGNTVILPVVATQPGLITADSSGSGVVAALNQDGSIHGVNNPATRGSVIQLFGTGEGVTRPAGVDGRVTPGLNATVATARVTIAGRDAKIQYLGSAPGLIAGVFQANVFIPDDCPSGLVPVSVIIGDYKSAATARIAVR